MDKSPGEGTVWSTDNGKVEGRSVVLAVVARFVGGVLVVLLIIIGKIVDVVVVVTRGVVTNVNFVVVLRLLPGALITKIEAGVCLTDPPGK